MPIVVEYGAPAQLGGAVAHQAGIGQFRQRKSQFDQQNKEFAAQQALREQEMALRQQAQAIQQEQFNQQFQLNAEQANIDNRYRQQAFNYGRRKDRAAVDIALREREQNRADTFLLNQMQQQGRLEEQEQKLLAQIQDRKVQQELLNTRDQARLEAEQDEREWDWNAQSAKGIDDQVEQRFADIRKMGLNEDGQARLNEFATKISALKAQRGNLRPGRYAERLSELMQSVESAGWEDYVQEEPTIQGVIGWGEEEVAAAKESGLQSGPGFQELPNGDYAIMKRDTKGNPYVDIDRGEREKPEDPAKAEAKQEKARKRAVADLTTEWKANLDPDSEEALNTTEKVFSPQEIARKVIYNQNIDKTMSKIVSLNAQGLGLDQIKYPESQAEIAGLMDGTYWVGPNGVLYIKMNGESYKVE